MARKIYFDTRSHHIGEYLLSQGFSKNGTTYTRLMLEVRQEDGKLYLINNALKEYRVIDGVFIAGHLKDFVRTGILPHKKLVKSLPIE